MEALLEHFIKAQETGTDTYNSALREVKAGRKTGHWIWYVFPQGPFGSSPLSKKFAITSLDLAQDFLGHPVLGLRLREITAVLLDHQETSISRIMGSQIDVLKLRSSMTLFAHVEEQNNNLGDIYSPCSSEPLGFGQR